MVDMDKVMSAMNAGDASKISPVIMRAQKKAAMAEARKLAAAKIYGAVFLTLLLTARWTYASVSSCPNRIYNATCMKSTRNLNRCRLASWRETPRLFSPLGILA